MTTATRGRKPVNGKAMTPAQRKQAQRQREKQKRSDMPNWLLTRHRLWKLIQNEFAFSNPYEVADAAVAIGTAIGIANQFVKHDSVKLAKDAVVYCLNPETAECETIKSIFRELRPFDSTVPPGYTESQSLIELIRDILESHESE